MDDREILLAQIARAERLAAGLNRGADRDSLLALAADLRAKLDEAPPGAAATANDGSPAG